MKGTTWFELRLNCTDSTENNGSIFPYSELTEEGVAPNVRLTLLSSVQIFASFRPQPSEMGFIFLSLLFENLGNNSDR